MKRRSIGSLATLGSNSLDLRELAVLNTDREIEASPDWIPALYIILRTRNAIHAPVNRHASLSLSDPPGVTITSKYSNVSNTLPFSTYRNAQSARRRIYPATTHQPPYPINKDPQDPVDVLQLLAHVEDLRPRIAAPPIVAPPIREEDPLLASRHPTSHRLPAPTAVPASTRGNQSISTRGSGRATKKKERANSRVTAPRRGGEHALQDPGLELVERPHNEYVLRPELSVPPLLEHLLRGVDDRASYS